MPGSESVALNFGEDGFATARLDSSRTHLPHERARNETTDSLRSAAPRSMIPRPRRFRGPAVETLEPPKPRESEKVDGQDECLRDGLDCPVCYTLMVDPVQIGCNHIFCRACLLQTAESEVRACPLCRAPFEPGTSSRWVTELRPHSATRLRVREKFPAEYKKLNSEVERTRRGKVSFWVGNTNTSDESLRARDRFSWTMYVRPCPENPNAHKLVTKVVYELHKCLGGQNIPYTSTALPAFELARLSDAFEGTVLIKVHLHWARPLKTETTVLEHWIGTDPAGSKERVSFEFDPLVLDSLLGKHRGAHAQRNKKPIRAPALHTSARFAANQAQIPGGEVGDPSRTAIATAHLAAASALNALALSVARAHAAAAMAAHSAARTSLDLRRIESARDFGRLPNMNKSLTSRQEARKARVVLGGARGRQHAADSRYRAEAEGLREMLASRRSASLQDLQDLRASIG